MRGRSTGSRRIPTGIASRPTANGIGESAAVRPAMANRVPDHDQQSDQPASHAAAQEHQRDRDHPHAKHRAQGHERRRPIHDRAFQPDHDHHRRQRDDPDQRASAQQHRVRSPRPRRRVAENAISPPGQRRSSQQPTPIPPTPRPDRRPSVQSFGPTRTPPVTTGTAPDDDFTDSPERLDSRAEVLRAGRAAGGRARGRGRSCRASPTGQPPRRSPASA